MKKYCLAIACALFLVGCSHENKNEISVNEPEKPISFETPIPSTEEIESSGNPFKETGEEKTATERSYILVPENSEFYWKAGKAVGSSHEGLILMEKGTLTLTPEKKIVGDFVVNMNEIVSLDLEEGPGESLVEHLKGDDFFSTKKFPTANLTITESNKKSEDTYTVTADLTIKGITNPITFEIKFLNIEDILVGMADINIDRTRWDIRYGSGKFFDDLGDTMINDIFETKITFSFIPEKIMKEAEMKQ